MYKIMVVEDEFLTRDWICRLLRKAFEDVVIDEAETELEFRQKLPAMIDDPPDLIIMDNFLPWTSPKRDIEEPPEEIKRDKIHNAGIRCMRLLGQYDTTRSVHVLFYTVLTMDDLSARLGSEARNLTYLHKDSTPEVLIDRVRSLLESAHADEVIH